MAQPEVRSYTRGYKNVTAWNHILSQRPQGNERAWGNIRYQTEFIKKWFRLCPHYVSRSHENVSEVTRKWDNLCQKLQGTGADWSHIRFHMSQGNRAASVIFCARGHKQIKQPRVISCAWGQREKEQPSVISCVRGHKEMEQPMVISLPEVTIKWSNLGSSVISCARGQMAMEQPGVTLRAKVIAN